MKIVHISATDNLGGAAKATFRIHRGLLDLGIDSKMLVGLKTETRRSEIDQIPRGNSLLARYSRRLLMRVEQATGLEYELLPWSRQFLDHPTLREADIVHLHNVHGGFFPLNVLKGLKGRNVVWSVHDFWPVTGHCYFPGMYECDRWKTGCGNCPGLRQDEYYPLSVDTTAGLWKKKRELYAGMKLTFVAQSQGTLDVLNLSPLAASARKALIPYALDTDVYRPGDRQAARSYLGLDANAVVVFFSAISLTSPRKGWKYLEEALLRLRTQLSKPVVLLAAGNDALPNEISSAYKVVYLGFVSNERLLSLAYNAADIFVAASMMETFGQVFSEAMACGVPQLAFDALGVRDVIRHGETGYLARYKDAGDLAERLRELIENPDLRAKMSKRSRETAEREYALPIQAKRFQSIYGEILSAAPTVVGSERV